MKKIINSMKCFFGSHIPNNERLNPFEWRWKEGRGTKINYECHCERCGTKLNMIEVEGQKSIQYSYPI